MYKSGSQLGKHSMTKYDADSGNNFRLQLQLSLCSEHILKYLEN